METKYLTDYQVLGKDGYVDCSSIQKHISIKDCKLFILETNHFLFCVDDHPMIINRNNVDITIEAKEVLVGDYIWVDNSVLFSIDENITPKVSPDKVVSGIYDLEHGVIDYIDERYLKGDSYNYRLHPKFNKFDKMWLKEFYGKLKDLNLDNMSSLNVIQQLNSINDILEEKRFCGYYKIMDISTRKYNHPLYDIKTETSEFLLGCVQNHNSFHMGGAVELTSLNLISEIMTQVDDVLLSKVNKLLKQTDDDIFSTTDFIQITLDKEVYKKKKFEETDTQFTLPVGYFEMAFRDMKIPVAIEQETFLYKPSEIEEMGSLIVLLFEKGDKVFTVKPKVKDYPKMANTVEGIISGNSPWIGASSLYLKLMKIFFLEEPYDSVHVEIMVSNILRNKTDPQIPARLKVPYDPILVSLKALPGVISWPLALSFENYSSAVQRGMISERTAPSPIEKVLFGESLVEK